MLEQLRTEIWRLHLELPKNHLVAWTSGNVSGRDAETGLVVIKPSGLRYEALTPECLLVVDVDGRIVEGNLKPSSDTATHLYIYRHRPDLRGIVHTHSPFATAFAAVNRFIPAALTAICDEFGGPIPCGGYARIGGEEIGRKVIRVIGVGPAILLRNHGVFAVGSTPEAAVKTAVMVEDVARTMVCALRIGEPSPIPVEEVRRAHRRYVEEYGQS